MIIYRLPWLYLGLAFLAYGIFGWIVAKSIGTWTTEIRESLEYWGLLISPITAKLLIYGLISLIIFVIILFLTIPSQSLNFLFGRGLKSDKHAIFAILFWSFIFVVILCFLEQFIRLLILLSASLLGRLELQELNYKNYQIMLILVMISLLGFTTGYFGFIYRL